MDKNKFDKPKDPDYKSYPKDDDIYSRGKELSFDEDMNVVENEDGFDDLDEDEDYEEDQENLEENEDYDEDFLPTIRKRIHTPDDDDWNTENFDTDHSGDDLDVPGSELDDDEEEIGSEDEENNYYSLGGPRNDD